MASHVLDYSGMLTFVGSSVVYKEPTPGMLSYGLAKFALHGLAMNAASLEGLQDEASVLTILPDTLYTKTNAESMPDADKTSWIPLDKLSHLLKMWADGGNRPVNGSFVDIKYTKGNLVPTIL